MKIPLPLITAVCIALSAPLTKASSYIDLVSLGTSGFTIDPDASTAGTGGALGITYSPSISLGDTTGGSFVSGPFNWDQYSAGTVGGSATDFAVKISILSGNNPNLPFSLSLVDSDGGILNFSGTSASATTGTWIPLTRALDPGVSSVLLGVTAGQFTWDGGATANVMVENLGAVPEPSTYALLSLAGLALGGYAMRRRRA